MKDWEKQGYVQSDEDRMPITGAWSGEDAWDSSEFHLFWMNAFHENMPTLAESEKNPDLMFAINSLYAAWVEMENPPPVEDGDATPW